MEISKLTEVLLQAKENKRLSYASLGKLVGHSEMWMAALFYGQAQATA
jgi:cyanate lyase